MRLLRAMRSVLFALPPGASLTPDELGRFYSFGRSKLSERGSTRDSSERRHPTQFGYRG